MGDIVVIDDERIFDGYLYNARYFQNSKDAIFYLATQWSLQKQFSNPGFDIDELWLDHDLGDEGGMMRDVVEFLANADMQIKQINVHSMNPVGAEYIVKHLLDHYPVMRVELPPTVHG